MKSAISSIDHNTHLLRAELIQSMKRGDSAARKLLSRLNDHNGECVFELVDRYQKCAGPLVMERCLFYLGVLCLGMSLGFCGLTAAGLVPVEVDSLFLCVGAFFLAQGCFFLYGRFSDARFYAEGYGRVLARLCRRRSAA